jgi:hypothetical protein
MPSRPAAITKSWSSGSSPPGPKAAAGVAVDIIRQAVAVEIDSADVEPA